MSITVETPYDFEVFQNWLDVSGQDVVGKLPSEVYINMTNYYDNSPLIGNSAVTPRSNSSWYEGSAIQAFSRYLEEQNQSHPITEKALEYARNSTFSNYVAYKSTEMSEVIDSIGAAVLCPTPDVIAGALSTMQLASESEMFTSNYTLFGRIKNRIEDWLYPETDTMPLVLGRDGKTYMPTEMVEELLDMKEEERWGNNEGYAFIDDESVNFVTGSVACVDPRAGWSSAKGFEYGFGTSGTSYFVSRSAPPAVLVYRDSGNEYTPNYYRETVRGETFYATHSSQSVFPTPVNSVTLDRAIEIIYFGDRVDPNPYPTGLAPWNGNTIDVHDNNIYVMSPSTDPSSPDDYQFKPYTPVNINPGGQGVTISPDINANPDINVPDIISAIISLLLGGRLLQNLFPDAYPQLEPTEREAPFVDVIPIPDYNPQQIIDMSPQTQPEPKQQIIDFSPPIINVTPPVDDGTIDIPATPVPTPVFTNEGGLATVYHPSPAALQAFGRWLWVTFEESSDVRYMWNNPFDGVISVHELYATPNDGAAMNIRSGFLNSEVSAPTVPNRYSEIDCGTVIIPEYYGNYLDYSPYSKAQLYLPFIGIKEVDPDDIVGNAVQIIYKVDSYSGACVAQVYVGRVINGQGSYMALKYQFGGDCSVTLPISGGSQAQLKATLAAGVMSGIASAVTGARATGVAGAIIGGTQAIGQLASSLMAKQSTVEHSGSMGGNFGAMGMKKPAIVVQAPIQVQVLNYNKEYGFPAHSFVKIGACTGFLRCREVNVISPRATNEEKTKIEELLKKGVFVQNE